MKKEEEEGVTWDPRKLPYGFDFAVITMMNTKFIMSRNKSKSLS